MNQFGAEVTSDDKLWVLLTYIFSPIIPVVILLMEDKKNRPFIRAHNAQALVVGVLNILIATFLGWLLVPLCVNVALSIALIYWGIKGYQGEMVEIPVVSNFVRQQGWA